jgi:predicted SnoaL-like aldol condensation-catalyzing enzyme
MLLKTGLKPILGLSALLLASTAAAQEAVTPTVNAEALFKSANPALNRNLQATYHIMKDLLEAGHWEKAPAYLTPRYIQHNPNVGSGRDTVVNFFASIGAKPKPIPPRLSAPVVKVLAQGDHVVVVTVATLPDPRAPGKTYTTNWFDMWRFIDGKADEHWDSATLMPPPPR